jgi:hypothetical protein
MKKNFIFLVIMSLFLSCGVFAQDENEENVVETEVLVEQEYEKPQTSISSNEVKGMHLSQFVSGSQILKERVNDLLTNTELNAVVIDVKEIDGIYCMKGIMNNIAYSSKIPDFSKYVQQLKEKGVYTIARIVVFRDNILPRKRPDLAVKTPEGEIWQDYKKITWLNPYKQEVRDYTLDVCDKAVELGFDEIQFDYIRFPSDGRIKNCRYGVAHSSITASNAIVEFLKQAKERLEPKGVKISIDVFGLTTTEKGDMGIGQRIVEMTKYVDYVSPMVYPSHYPNGCYGIPNPNKEPYRTVYLALAGGIKRLPVEKLRPWIQDFSMRGVQYGPEEIKAQIQACFDVDVKTWLLWNAACKYTKSGLKTKEKQDTYTKSSQEKIDKLLKTKNIDDSINKGWKAQQGQVKKSTTTANKTNNVQKKSTNTNKVSQTNSAK